MSNLINKVSNFKNVKIVSIPNEGMINSNFLAVYDFDNPTIEHIKSNEYKSIFYIYQIEENHARWVELEAGIKYLKELRKEKLKKLEKL
jgi:hypothetical protein